MTYFQPLRAGQWGKFSTPQVVNKTIISGSFNNYNSGFGGGCGMPMGGMVMGCGMDYSSMGCCGGGGSKPFWGGFLGGFLGGILGGGNGGGGFLGGIFGGGGGIQPQGGYYPGVQGGDGLDSLRELYPDNKFSRVGNSFVCVTKDGKQITGKSPDELLKKLGSGDSAQTKALTGGDRDTALKELKEEATKFNETYKNDKVGLSVNDNPDGDKSKGTDLQYTLTYTDSKGQPHTAEFRTVPTKGEIDAFKQSIEAKVAGGGDGDPSKVKKGGNGGDGAGGAVSPKSAFEEVFNMDKLPKGMTYVEGQGMKGPDGNIYKTPADLYAKLASGNSAVSSKDFDISKLDGQNILSHDSGKPADITGEVSINKDSKTITINGHTYQLVENSGDFVYFKDPDANNTGKKGQTYILEKAPGGGYRLSQYDFTKLTDGWNISAHSN